MHEEIKMIERAKKDPRAFEPLYNKYHEQIFRYVNNRINDINHSCDIVSQVFMKAISNLHKFEHRGVPFGSWLYRIASSELNQWFRDTKAERKVSVPFENFRLELIDDESSDNGRLKELLGESLNELPESDLELIELRYFEKRSVKEIAEMKNLSESNAKVKCHRAMNKLRKILSNKL